MHTGPVAELSARTVTALTAQARLQISPRVDGKPPYEVVDAQPLMVLPDANKGDLFFDFEGDPLWTVDGREWGLEYLWGVLTATGSAGRRPRQMNSTRSGLTTAPVNARRSSTSWPWSASG